MSTFRKEMRSTLVGALVLIFFVLMGYDLYGRWFNHQVDFFRSTSCQPQATRM